MKQGFSLIEVMLALAITAMFGGILVQVLSQLGGTQARVLAISSIDIQALVAFHTLEKDISGAFVPELRSLDEKPVEAPSLVSSSQDKPQEFSEKSDSSKNTKKPEKVFESNNGADGNLKFLTCITTNPLNVYATAKPCVARVVYVLAPDSESNKNHFVLYRYETSKVADIAAFGFNQEQVVTRGVLVMRNIVACGVEFLAVPEKAKKDDQKSSDSKSSDDKDAEKKFIKSVVWEGSSESEQDVQEGKMPDLPHSMIMTMRIMDERSKEYTWVGTFSPLYGLESIVLEGNKPLAQKTTQDRAIDKLGDVMYDNPLSKGLQKKFETWQPTEAGASAEKRTAPPAPPSGGQIMQGMAQ